MFSGYPWRRPFTAGVFPRETPAPLSDPRSEMLTQKYRRLTRNAGFRCSKFQLLSDL